MNINKRKDKLIEMLKNKEYRDAFVSEHIDTGIPFQIRSLREQKQREWTQEELANRARMKQEAISRIENPNYGKLSLSTLKKLASAFDVGLMVRFVPYGDLVSWDVNLSSESLEVPSFEDDPYFKEKEDIIEGKLLAISEQVPVYTGINESDLYGKNQMKPIKNPDSIQTTIQSPLLRSIRGGKQ